MALLVTLKPPTALTTGSCHDNIELHAERIDYTVLNEVEHHRTAVDGRAVQLISGQVQINITGSCVEENGNTALENAEILECAARTWKHRDYVSSSTQTTYPKINWRLGDQYMLIQKLSIIDEGRAAGNKLDYLLTIYVDKR